MDKVTVQGVETSLPNQDAIAFRFLLSDGFLRPAGRIQFQQGPVAENGINGVQNEDVIRGLIDRIEVLDAQFPCTENEDAILSLQDALAALNARTERRTEQGTEGHDVEYSEPLNFDATTDTSLFGLEAALVADNEEAEGEE